MDLRLVFGRLAFTAASPMFASFNTFSTTSRFAGETSSGWLSTFETVPSETPARRAIIRRLIGNT